MSCLQGSIKTHSFGFRHVFFIFPFFFVNGNTGEKRSPWGSSEGYSVKCLRPHRCELKLPVANRNRNCQWDMPETRHSYGSVSFLLPHTHTHTHVHFVFSFGGGCVALDSLTYFILASNWSDETRWRAQDLTRRAWDPLDRQLLKSFLKNRKIAPRMR